MHQLATLIPRSRPAKRPGGRPVLGMRLCLALLLIVSPAAFAVDGCLVLLCFAAPNWRAIPQCVPPIGQVLRDLARGKPFPTCSLSGSAHTASHRWAVAPSYCPPQYTRLVELDAGVQYTCDFVGAISVSVENSLWSRTWWNFSGDAVTEYTPAAKVRLGNWHTRFEDDYAAWLTALPPSVPCPTC